MLGSSPPKEHATPNRILVRVNNADHNQSFYLAAFFDAIAKNPQAVEIIREGGKKKEKSFGFLMGQVMQASRGAAPPAEVQKLLREKLG